ncbi:MAG: hypothetical protein J3Q66DRAFT_201325 [Benniella sp.]|nr:MAG: hypothetical protein J3Q66DRAFT_201325 [Benniella sp.]
MAVQPAVSSFCFFPLLYTFCHTQPFPQPSQFSPSHPLTPLSPLPLSTSSSCLRLSTQFYQKIPEDFFRSRRGIDEGLGSCRKSSPRCGTIGKKVACSRSLWT